MTIQQINNFLSKNKARHKITCDCSEKKRQKGTKSTIEFRAGLHVSAMSRLSISFAILHLFFRNQAIQLTKYCADFVKLF